MVSSASFTGCLELVSSPV